MSKTVSKLALTASLVLAMAFTFSCSGDDGGGKEVIVTISRTQVSYDASGAVSGNSTTGRTEYEYDSKGNQIKRFEYDANGNGGLVLEYEYDSRGNLVKEIYFTNNGITGGTEYNCNSDGSFCTSNMYIHSTGEIIETGEVRYTTINSKRLLISQTRTSTSSNGNNYKTEYEWDSKGNITKMTGYVQQSDANDYTLILDIKYENHEYDSRGNATRVSSYSGQTGGSYTETTYTYTYKTI